MAEYRVPEFTAEQRAEVALQRMLPFPDRQWGLVTKLARQYGVSRNLLYRLRDRAWEATVEALMPRPAGRPTQTPTLTVDKALIDWFIIILALLKGTVRDIHLGLSLLLGVTRSVGYWFVNFELMCYTSWENALPWKCQNEQALHCSAE